MIGPSMVRHVSELEIGVSIGGRGPLADGSRAMISEEAEGEDAKILHTCDLVRAPLCPTLMAPGLFVASTPASSVRSGILHSGIALAALLFACRGLLPRSKQTRKDLPENSQPEKLTAARMLSGDSRLNTDNPQ